MSKLYNTQKDISSAFSKFLKSIFPSFSKPMLKLIPNIIIGLLDSESIVTSDIASRLHDIFDSNQIDSIQRRFRRLFSNPNFDIYSIYDAFISHIINHFHFKHSDHRIHISIDHMFCKEQFAILCFTLRIGRQGIPIWFRCFKGMNNPNAFQFDLLKEGVLYVHNLFQGKNAKIIFLADRWFNNMPLLNYIDSLGDTFVIRIKNNLRIYKYEKSEKHKIWTTIGKIQSYAYHSKILTDIKISNHQCEYAVVLGKNKDHSDSLKVITNGDPKRAIKDYGYRFGSIECIFKTQKSNGFRLESTNVRKEENFAGIYGLMNIALVWMTILGCDYSKNKHNKRERITDTKRTKGKIKRMMSFFQIGLTLFHRAFNSTIKRILKYDFILYDV